MQSKKLKIALVHEWLTNFAGAERVLLAFHEIWPEAPIYTTVYNAEKMPQFKNAKIITSFLQKWPLAKKKHQLYLPLMPLAFEQFDLSEYDIVLSSSHACAKGVITKPTTLHITFCHTPMRYAWDDSHKYIRESNFPGLIKKFIPLMMNYIRLWDRMSADRVDKFIANSNFVAKRIKKYYGREAEVIYPPVNAANYAISDKVEDYFLTVGRLIPYKRVDIAVEAFNQLGLPLKIIGTGPEMKRLQKIAGKNIEFLGWLPDEEVKEYLSKCLAFIFCAEEDFGIAPLEAMASGRPVIAYGRGGATESVIGGITGMFFDQQTPESLINCISNFHPEKYNPIIIRQHALKFDVDVFKRKIKEFVEREWEEYSGQSSKNEKLKT